MSRKALGRGLDALFTQGVPVDHDLMDLDIDQIDPAEKQPRGIFREAKLEELAQSIRQRGIIQPLVVRRRGERFQIIAGERRWRAAQRAGLHRIPCVVKEVAEEDVLEISLIENIQREELNQGRTFSEREATEVSRVVIVNRALADRYFPGEDPIGKRIAIAMSDNPVPSSIVGVVGDVRYQGLELDVRPMAYWPHPELARSFMTLVLRANGDPAALATALRHEVLAMDKDQPIADVRTMDDLLSTSIARARFSALLLAVFAGVALVLAAVGIYGVMSYSVEQRTREIGIRMALGAGRGDVVAMVVRQGMTLSLIGVAVGLGAAWALTRFLASLLFQVTVTDPASFASIPFVLIVVALVASLIPARRATKVDPIEALRYE